MPERDEFRKVLNIALGRMAAIICGLLIFIATIFMNQLSRLGDRISNVNDKVIDISGRYEQLDRIIKSHEQAFTDLRVQREKDRDQMAIEVRGIRDSLGSQAISFGRVENAVENIQNQVNRLAEISDPNAQRKTVFQ